jgi:hypothetical protein
MKNFMVEDLLWQPASADSPLALADARGDVDSKW